MAAIDLFGLDDKVALVSGGSRGIGEAIAMALAEQGAHVIVSSRKLESCETVAAGIREHGGKATAMQCHAGNMDDIETLFVEIKEQFGRLDVLINNGGTNPHFGSVLDLSVGAFDKTVEVNLRGPYFMSARAVELMKLSDGGSIVNVASVNAFRASSAQAIYSATKAAMVSMTQSFAMECGEHGVRVNALCPGLTDTKLIKVFKEDAGLQKLLERYPVKRMAQPQDMVGAVLLMVTEAGACMTGQTIVVDSGAMIIQNLNPE
jgi:NAD(P)-dependent dehydrogenase (short-subunit alcohol dehydrogenase family)